MMAFGGFGADGFAVAVALVKVERFARPQWGGDGHVMIRGKLKAAIDDNHLWRPGARGEK